MAIMDFDATTVAPATAYTPLPKGTYLAMIIDSEMKPTKSGSGEYLMITLEILDGQYKGRKLFDRLNIRNSNAVAEEIAQRTLSAICKACGIGRLTDSDQLHNTPMAITVSIEPARGEYDASNRIKAYAGTRDTATVEMPLTQAPKPTATKPAWKR